MAEEGIDVGEVDLIVCFDVNNKNPTRYIQRIGRTGRKRQGKVIMLVTEGKEHSILQGVMSAKDGTNQKLTKSGDVTRALYRDSPRMVPPEFRPKCLETYIKIDDAQPAIMNTSSIPDPGPSKPKASEAMASKAKPAATKPAATKPAKRVQPTRGSKPSTKQPSIRQAFVKLTKIDDELLRDFDLSDSLNTSTISHSVHEETASDQLEPSEMLAQHPADGVSTKEKFMKICERYRTIKKCPNGDGKPLDAATVINNPNLAKPLKVMWLINNSEFVREHFNRRETSRMYSSIAKILGGDRAVQKMLDARDEDWANMKPMRQISIFQMLQRVDRVEEKENVAESVPEIDLDTSQLVSMPFESQLCFGFVESKYASQFETQQPAPEPILRPEALSSSTPKRAILCPSTPANVRPPIDSPINRTTSSERKRVRGRKDIPETVPHYLRFLGLSSIDDLFSSSDDEIYANPQPGEVEVEKMDANSNHIPANPIATGGMEESDLFADESMSPSKPLNTSTISQATAMTTATSRVHRLHVGSVSDLFRDDDWDVDETNAANDDAQNDTVPKTDSDDTEEYDFEQIISALDDAETTATSRLMDSSSQKENLVKNQTTVVSQHKSDDLFATYNDTIDTNADRSCANQTGASKFSVLTPPKAAKISGVAANSSSQHSPSNRLSLNYAHMYEKSPSVLNRSSVCRSQSSTSSKSLLGKFNATARSSDAQSDENHSLHDGPSSSFHQPKKLNFARLMQTPVPAMDNLSGETGTSQFLTCRTATSGQDAGATSKSQIDQLNTNISTESETPDEDEIFATCQLVRHRCSPFFDLSLIVFKFVEETSAGVPKTVASAAEDNVMQTKAGSVRFHR